MLPLQMEQGQGTEVYFSWLRIPLPDVAHFISVSSNLLNQINQILQYTRCNTPKRVTSWRGPSPRHCARATQLLSKKGVQFVSNLTDPRFEPQTFRSRDERVTARPTGRSKSFCNVILNFENVHAEIRKCMNFYF